MTPQKKLKPLSRKMQFFDLHNNCVRQVISKFKFMVIKLLNGENKSLFNYFHTIEQISLGHSRAHIWRIRTLQCILLVFICRMLLFVLLDLSPHNRLLWYDLFALIGFKPEHNLVLALQIALLTCLCQLLYFDNYRQSAILLQRILFHNDSSSFAKSTIEGRSICAAVQNFTQLVVSLLSIFKLIACKL